MSRCARLLVLALLVSGCGKDGGGTTVEGTGSTASTSTGASGTTGTGTSAGATTEGGTTDIAPTTGVDVSGFERFVMSTAAGPCAPRSDCDGFVELLASRRLRVEVFGDIDDTVVEVDIAEADFTAAVQVFAAPDLLALLDGGEPLCDPPTDVFESMTVEIDGAPHEATTTACDQAPVVAARTAAIDLRMKYVP